MLARPSLRGGAVHQRPLRRQPLAPLEAPVGVEPGHPLPEPFIADVVEQPPPDHLAHLRLVVREQVLGHAPDHLGDLVLPRQIEVRHLHLAARQADDRRAVRRPRHRDGQVLDERMERIRHLPVAVDEVDTRRTTTSTGAPPPANHPTRARSWRRVVGVGPSSSTPRSPAS